MIIIPVYNKQLISDGKLYFQTDEFMKAGGRAVQGEKVVFVQNRYRQDRPTAIELVTIGRKYAVWKIAMPFIFWFKRFAMRIARTVAMGTTVNT